MLGLTRRYRVSVRDTHATLELLLFYSVQLSVRYAFALRNSEVRHVLQMEHE
jgi:hypothetical protein